MLQSLRKSVGSIVIKVLFGLLVLSFAVWGISDTYIFGQTGDTVAEVGDREISAPTLQRAFRNEMQRLRPLNIDEERARQLGVLDQVLNRLVSATLYDEAARKMGMVVGEAALREHIREQFGNISAAEFQNILRNAGLSEGQYLAQLRDDIIRQQYLDTLTQGTAAPKPLVDALYAWREEKRRAAIVTVPVDPKSAVREPSTTELEEFYKARPSDFTAPEYRAVSYVFLDPQKARESVDVSEEKLRALYEDRLETLSTPERRTLLQMLLPDEAAAQNALDLMSKGESFVAVAKRLAGQDEGATRLGSLSRKDLPPELANAAFALKTGGVSQPLQGPFGTQLIKVEEITPGKTPTFDEVRENLAKDLAEEEAIDLVSEQANRLEEALGSGATLQEAAREVGVPVIKIASLDREGRDSSDKTVENIPQAPFLESVFETPDGGDSLLLETPDNGFFVLHVDSVTAPALRPLDSVRAEAIADWKAEQRWDTARAEAKKLVERLNNGAKAADIAKETGFKLTETQSFTRNGSGAPANTPPTIVSELFAAKSIGRAAMGNGTSGVEVAQLTQIDKATPSQDKEGVEALTQSLRLGIANDIAAQLDSALRKRHNVNVNPEVVQYYFYRDEGES